MAGGSIMRLQYQTNDGWQFVKYSIWNLLNDFTGFIEQFSFNKETMKEVINMLGPH